jgi:hypothetical protein
MQTLLTVVQKVLSDMNESRVSSIHDTDVAEQVASVAVDVYSAILTEYPWVIKESLVKPLSIEKTTLTLPYSTQRIKVVKYSPSHKCDESCTTGTVESGTPMDEWTPQCNRWNNCVTNEYFTETPWPKPKDYESSCVDLVFLELEEFLTCCSNRDSSVCDTCKVSDGSQEYSCMIRKDKDPEFWTVIDNKVVLDSYCFADGSRIMDHRLTILGETAPELRMRDRQPIDLPIEVFNYFLAEVKSTSFYTIKQLPNEKEESRSQRLRRRLLRENGLQGRKRTRVDFDYGSSWRK